MDKLKTMKTFMLTVEEGSMVRAAKRLNITKAAASKQLIDLENNLNTQLLHRTTRVLQLTDTGRLFYESIKKVFAAMNEAEAIVTQINDNPVGILRITSHRNFGEKYIINHLNEFINLYPDLKIDLELADRFPDLEKENIDVLCGVVHDGPDHLVRRKIATVHQLLCASPHYLQKFGIPKIPDELKNHRYITHSFRNPDNLLVFNNKKEIYLDYCLKVNDAQTMMKCALQGLGIIKIHNYFVEEAIKSGDLIEILPAFREAEKSMYVFYQQQKFIQPKIRLFLDFIYSKMKVPALTLEPTNGY